MDLSPDDDHFQGRLLHQAALWDNVELLQELLSSGVDVNSPDNNYRTALHAAALAEGSRCLRALCAAGADVDVKSDAVTGGKTAMHIASERGHVENVKTLLEYGASVHVPDGSGECVDTGRCRRVLVEGRDLLERERLSHHAELRDLVMRGDHQLLKAKLLNLGENASPLVNMTPNGANTLLYVASETGCLPSVTALIEAGADARPHPVTKYCPLYIAAYHGHLDIARVLLARFPASVQQETVERWLPIHAACIGGHASMVTLLLEYPYPEEVLLNFTVGARWRYKAAFDVNAGDVSGHTPLYQACALGSLAVVDALLNHTAICTKLDDAAEVQEEEDASASSAQILSPHRAGISMGIHAIVSKLTGNANKYDKEEERRVRPVQLDRPCGGEPAVSCAARGAAGGLGRGSRGGHLKVLRRLLAAGAAADARALPPREVIPASDLTKDGRRRSRSAHAKSTSPSPNRNSYSDRDGPWTALSISARFACVPAMEALLAHGARDPASAALRECAKHGLADMITALLATKAYPDPEHKINRGKVSETVFSCQSDSQLTYSALCPTIPVMLDWRELRCQITTLRMSWLRHAALKVNPKLGSPLAASHALTRIDVSNNELKVLPAELFTLFSLRYLNAAQNKLERLPSLADPGDEEYDQGRKVRRRKSRPELYSAPVLQELYLQDNRLEQIPSELFSLPALTTLDLSNNKLRALPPAMWTAPSLQQLNVQLNHLCDLPVPVDQQEPSSPGLQSPSEPTPASPLPSNTHFQYHSNSKSSSRSPSIERSESEANDEDVPVLGNRAGNTVCSEASRAHTWRGAVAAPEPARARSGSGLSSLNLAHNQFTCVPSVLACTAPALNTLNMAYNSLRSMSYVTSYPTSLRQLDLSHNEITCWPSLPQIESFGCLEGDPLACYCPESEARPRPRSGGSVRCQLLSAACPARRHLRLEGLRTLILANNLLTRIQLTTDGDGYTAYTADGSNNDDDDEWGSASSLKGRLMFPLLSMLDVSSNLLKTIPPAIHELTNLSVLNISGNKEITDLPPQMGLLSRLWNLNTAGCSLQEPLRSMISGGKCRSVDIIGYLKSVLHDATTYTTMKLMLVGLQGIGKTSLLECLRQESAIQHRRKPTEHWSKRMGNKSSRRNMSTVGVDIGTWVYEKMRSNRGPVTFRTWDFGGQQEYYSTHQYFLSRRSLYLVVWKVTDGKKGLAGAVNWLRSIQARAPGSPVIMVATHYDQVGNSNLPENESPDALQRHIRSNIMGAPDADKLGLPKVMDSLEVSCSSKHNIRLLADIIYTVAFSVKPPGSKEPLLEQRVPASYLALEECVTAIASELQEPVLRHVEYKRLVTQYMQQKNHRMFRDAAELHQATMFLHENGVLLHYDDATLKELYFLRPQWLCDLLAHVVTVREINPFASSGIMKIEDLAHVFKASPQLGRGEDAISLGVSLLSKFELALCWDGRLLIVPPLLPDVEPGAPQLPLRSRSWGNERGTPRRVWPNNISLSAEKRSDSPTLIKPKDVIITGRASLPAYRRVLAVSYVPRGFSVRLCARLLADAALADAALALYAVPREMELDEYTQQALDLQWSWKVWKSGVRLISGDLTLLQLRQLDRDEPHEQGLNLRFRIRQEGAWCELDAQTSSCIEIVVPAPVCVIRREDGTPIAGYQSISLEPNPEILTKVLALLSDHVDLLLEDWYPSLGTRFVHTSEGRCLITRVVPCYACMKEAQEPNPPPDGPGVADEHLAQELRNLDLDGRRLRLSEESGASDRDSGVGNESNASSRVGSVEGVLSAPLSPLVYGWTVEECILAACTNKPINCPLHPHVKLTHVAPDTLLLDVEEHKRARWEHVSRSAVVGRGAFGTVLEARWAPPGRPARAVALKALQPVPPPPNTDVHAHHAYKALLSRWERDATSGACRAYCGLRQELSILSQLQHPHVVQLVAVCCSPLALLLALAPMGALDVVLRGYRGCGARAGARAARAAALQLARALEYLHAHRIVYRDLKSENVLVWEMPKPQDATAAELSTKPIPVHVKLGDYGISRLAPPSGTKGFGGTEGFMAPEIMRYNGEEEYNEKVDCFSFGMLLYEIVTLRQPFEGHEAVKEAVLEGARPSLSPRDLQYPCLVLETMRRCWSGAPELRPSAAALVALVAAPEYGALRDAAVARQAFAGAPTAIIVDEEGQAGWEVWYGGGEPERAHTLVATPTAFTQHHTMRIAPDKDEPVTVTSICRVGSKMWIGDSAGRVSVYSAARCALSWRVRVSDAVGGAASAVTALLSLHSLHRVALALACGRLFLVTASKPEAEGSFVLTELGTATELNCLTSVNTMTGVELWAGGAGLYAYALNATGVCGADTLPAEGGVALVAAADDLPCVYVYMTPGVCVYQYCAETRRQTAKLECSKLVPCSESLRTINIDELYSGHCTVTALCWCGGSVYVGTSWGCLIVADASTLRPITVFRAYEQDVRVIVGLPPLVGDEGPPMIATFGTGYRPLLNRYTQQPTSAANTHNYSGSHCLLWRTGNWLPD